MMLQLCFDSGCFVDLIGVTDYQAAGIAVVEKMMMEGAGGVVVVGPGVLIVGAVGFDDEVGVVVVDDVVVDGGSDDVEGVADDCGEGYCYCC